MFCDDNKKEDALVLMNKVVVLEHHQAEYCLNFLKLFTGIQKYEHEGIIGLSNISLAWRAAPPFHLPMRLRSKDEEIDMLYPIILSHSSVLASGG